MLVYAKYSNIQTSKNTVLISNISIITFLNFVFYTRAASLLASRGLEAQGRTSRGRGQDPPWGQGQDPRGRGQDPRGQGRGQVFLASRLRPGLEA